VTEAPQNIEYGKFAIPRCIVTLKGGMCKPCPNRGGAGGGGGVGVGAGGGTRRPAGGRQELLTCFFTVHLSWRLRLVS